MKTTSKEDYINITCKELCEKYGTCDKSHIYIFDSGKSISIGCSAYKRKEIKDEGKKRGSMVL